MASPNFSAQPGTTWTDPSSGVTYISGSNGSWSPISSGSNQGPQSPVPPSNTPAPSTPPPSNTGGGSSGGSSGVSFDQMNGSVNPGPGYWWDAANGWQPVNGGGGESEAERKAREAQAAWEKLINEGYGQYTDKLNQMIGGYGQEQTERLRALDGTYGTILEGLGGAKKTALDKIALTGQDVVRRGEDSAKDLQFKLRQMMQNMQTQLGAMGAGDSSAARMAAYAYTKMGGREYGNIQRQVNDQKFQLSQDELDVANTFEQLKNQSQLEKAGQVENIKTYYSGILNQINQQLANAPLEKAQALSQIHSQVLAEAQNKLAMLEQAHVQQQMAMQQWATERLAQLNDYKLQISGQANFNPGQIVAGEIGGGQFQPMQTMGQQQQMLNPLLLAQNKRKGLGIEL